MSIHDRPSAWSTGPDLHSPAAGLLVLAGTKSLDLVTTLVGLRASPHIVEANGLVAGAMAALGVAPALLVLSALTVATITGATELAAVLTRRSETTPSSGVVRIVGYGVPSLFHVGVAIHNTTVIAAV
jgi:hypothetical protein